MLHSEEDLIDSFHHGWEADMSFDLNDLGVDFDNKTLPFKLVSPDDLDALDDDDDIANQESRELSGLLNVTIKNDCSESVLVAIIYKNTEGTLVHKGLYTLESQHQVDFTDVTESKYAMYAMNSDGSFTWNDSPSTSTYCFYNNTRCYKDFSVNSSSTSTTQHLYCNRNDDIGSVSAAAVAVTGRAAQWLTAHNVRRETFHRSRGRSGRDLQWSQKLADSARGYAQKLISIGGSSSCNIMHNYQGDSNGGENIAANWGPPYLPPSPESILYRWFEGEASKGWPANAVSQCGANVTAGY